MDGGVDEREGRRERGGEDRSKRKEIIYRLKSFKRHTTQLHVLESLDRHQ